ncbi:MAG: hypothetical protein B6D59_05200 [Campylobacteraceae bacterium 4484_4]|nr:MAG: hypothetical protein B6D59_05200 [Campylobacteraceae bacterium 4484_4]
MRTLPLSLFVIFILTACSTKSLAPASVADDFWSAYRDGRMDIAKSYTLSEDPKKLKLIKKIEIVRYSFGELKKEGDIADLETTMYLRSRVLNRQEEVRVDFDTRLVRDPDRGWRVDMSETKRRLYPQLVRKFGAAFGKDIMSIFKEGIGDFGKLLEQLLQGLKKEDEK